MAFQTNITTFLEGTFPGLIKLREDSFQCPWCLRQPSCPNPSFAGPAEVNCETQWYSSSSDRSSTTNADPTTTNADPTTTNVDPTATNADPTAQCRPHRH
ncbi:hypothetical protein D9C73_011981 [Collichthys lucidus]|uniref:Uncharacterized protein n=1 Tax=Collichthys lucidus TaxID=240159 RepID=A0A4U5UWX9_COLLU|nr:hypothetical protein D9C73_011981 [Collichthys lucidus]